MERIRRYHQIRGGARSPNDEISPPGRVWDRELTENRWIHLLRLGSPKHRRENSIARTARLERNRYPLVESHSIRNLRLCPFGSLAKNPLANIGWAVNQYDAPVLGLSQESNNLNVHKSDFTWVHEIGERAHRPFEPGCRRYWPIAFDLSCRVVVCPSDSFFSTHHRLLDSKIHVPAVFGYGWRVHLQAIEEKRVTSIHSGAFSANDEDSTNCLRRTWYRRLMPACGRNARRVGNFCESKRQHVMRSMRADVKYGRTVIRNQT